MNCTRCEGTGFVNLHQVDAETVSRFNDLGDHQVITDWIAAHNDHDVGVCDCCGDGDGWHGEPGKHYGPDDPQGPGGPYPGGLCGCH
jgi:hypothetical protein